MLASCVVGSGHPTSSPTPSVTPSVAPTASLTPTSEPQSGGSLIVALPREPDSLNFTVTDSMISRWAISTVDARMIGIRDDGTPEPILLSEIPTVANGGIAGGGLRYTLRFKPDLKWSDGETLDARDFRFTWQTITNPAYPAVSRAGWSLIDSIALSDNNLIATVHLRRPSAGFFDEVLAGSGADAGGLLLPAHVLTDTQPSAIPDSPYGADQHVGSGPFRVAKWTPGEELVVERNPHFAGQQALLDRIVFRFVGNPRQAISALTTGEVDLAVNLPDTSLPDLAQAPDTNALLTPRAGAVDMLAFNLNDPRDLTRPHPLFSDPAVRRAIALAFNRQALVHDLLLGQAAVAATPLDNTPWADASITPYPFDPREAASLLDQAGWLPQADGVRARNGLRLSFTLTTPSDDDPAAALHRQIQDAFIRDLRQIGIDVQPRNESRQDLAAPDGILSTRQFDMVDLWGEERSGLTELAWRFGSLAIPTKTDPRGANVMGYSSPVVDRLLVEQERTLDPAGRRQVVSQILQRIHLDVPVVPVYDHLEIDVGRRYVRGLKPAAPSGLWWNTEEWWVDRSGAED